MRIIDRFGEDVTNLVLVEPYTNFIEINSKKHPITRVVYGYSRFEIEWGDPIEN